MVEDGQKKNRKLQEMVQIGQEMVHNAQDKMVKKRSGNGQKMPGKGNKKSPKKTAENEISQQPMDNNGIRFLRLKRFWNVKQKRTENIMFSLFFPVFLVSTNRD